MTNSGTNLHQDAGNLEAQAQDLARDLQSMTGGAGGGFNPLAMIAGERHFHSVFLAPLSPSIERAREQFMADGSGPLTGLVQQFQSGGATAAEAASRVRELLAHAKGMLIVVMQDGQGLITVPQLYFGNLHEAYRKQAVDLCGDQFPDRDGLTGSLLGLEQLLQQGQHWPSLFNGVHCSDQPVSYWTTLGSELVRSLDEGLFGNAPDRLAEIGYFIGTALESLATADGPAGPQSAIDGNSWYVASRAFCVAADASSAARCAGHLLENFEPEDEALAVLVQHLVDVAVRENEPQQALQFLADNETALENILGGLYELELPRFKATAAAMRPADELLAAAERLKKADRKAFRHDLNREPLWRVAVTDPGEVLDTNQAADHLERSINFVAKRLEQGTIPFHRDGDVVRIPIIALNAWSQVMAHYQLID